MRGLQRTRVCLSDLLDPCIMKSFSIGHNSVQWDLSPAACTENTSPYARMRAFFSLRIHCALTRGAQGLMSHRVCLKNCFISCHVFVPSTPFHLFFTASVTSLTTLSHLRYQLEADNNPALLCWRGNSLVIWQIPFRTQVMSPNLLECKFCIDIDGEHTQINLPTRNMSFRKSTPRRSPIQ